MSKFQRSLACGYHILNYQQKIIESHQQYTMFLLSYLALGNQIFSWLQLATSMSKTKAHPKFTSW